MTDFLKFIKAIPPVKWYRVRKYRRKFLSTRGWMNLHFGIFDSYEQARAALPMVKVTEWLPDNEGWYISEYNKIEIIDYPILFWLQKLIKSGYHVFDFGGHAGIAYHKYSRYLDYPNDFHWVICEQPVVIKLGQEMFEKTGGPHLSYIVDFKQAANFPIFHSAGCIQYVEQPLASLLADLDKLPQHLILTKIPLYEQPTKVTLQNTGSSISPNWLFNREVFINDISKLGYELIDSWPCPGRRNYIPFHAEYNVEKMSGLYFRLKT